MFPHNRFFLSRLDTLLENSCRIPGIPWQFYLEPLDIQNNEKCRVHPFQFSYYTNGQTRAHNDLPEFRDLD